MVGDLFVVGQFIAETSRGIVWDFQGVFDSREKAFAACRDESYSVQSAVLNQELPHESSEFPDCEYPLLGNAEASHG